MFTPVYRIVTSQFVIRCYNPGDAFHLANSITESLDHLLPWMPWASAEPEPIDAKIERLRKMRSNFDLNIDFVYGIFNLQGDQLLGGTGLHPRLGSDALEIGYWVHKDYLNRGIATKAAAVLTKIAFEIYKVKRVEIHCSVENVRSAAVPRKLGFTQEATLQQRTFANDHLSDQMIWSLFFGNYHQSPSANIEFTAYDAAERRIK